LNFSFPYFTISPSSTLLHCRPRHSYYRSDSPFLLPFSLLPYQSLTTIFTSPTNILKRKRVNLSFNAFRTDLPTAKDSPHPNIGGALTEFETIKSDLQKSTFVFRLATSFILYRSNRLQRSYPDID
jgi:hypothetical protein